MCARGLSHFTAEVSSAIDSIVAFDKYAVKRLERIAIRQQHVPELSQKMTSFLNPLSAFQSSAAAQIKKELKHVSLSTSARIGDKIKC